MHAAKTATGSEQLKRGKVPFALGDGGLGGEPRRRARFVGLSMPIEFACPNGHILKAPEERAGKTGKCPKCGVAFVVPSAEEPIEDFEAEAPPAGPPDETAAESPVAETSTSAAPSDSATAASPVAAAEPEKPAPEETITFLCPNGHKLTSPARLQGKAGKCPHCGEKFRVPMLDEAEEEPEEFGVEENEYAFAEEGVDEFAEEGEFGDEIPDDALVEEELGPPHPTRLLFERLFREREHGGKLRLHLSEGGVLDADFYARRYSRGGYGVVASRDDKGNYKITAVHWDAVQRIEVDELVNLPEGVFE
ncbi:MAG: hypothetical protein DCC68_06385 [Planctomycetota bacterium]|nr:MAG: hypothetical protein DCC68_06385 [Planctomycetota bacterium]